MRLFYVHKIEWDVDPNEGLQEGLGLPSNAYVHAEDEDSIADALSDHYDWCVRSMGSVTPWDGTLVFWA